MDTSGSSQSQNSSSDMSTAIPDLSSLMDSSSPDIETSTQQTHDSSSGNTMESSSPPSDIPQKRSNKGIIIAIILFILISLPIVATIVVQTQNKNSIADIRNQAAYPGCSCRSENAICGITQDDRLDDTCSSGHSCCIQGLPTVTPITTVTPTPVSACTQPNPNPDQSKHYCDRDAPNESGCIDKSTGDPCNIRPECGGGSGFCRIVINGPITECGCYRGGGGSNPTATPTPGCANPNGSTHRECVGNTCQTVNNAPGVCDNEDNNTCDNNAQCTNNPTSPPNPTNTPQPTATRTPTPTVGSSPTAGPSPTPTNTPIPTNTPVIGQCQNIKIYRDNILITDYSVLRNGDNIVIAVVGTNATEARVKVNGELNWRNSSTTNGLGEWVVNYQLPNDGTLTFSIIAELFIGGIWK